MGRPRVRGGLADTSMFAERSVSQRRLFLETSKDLLRNKRDGEKPEG